MTALSEHLAALELSQPWRTQARCRNAPGMHFDHALETQAKLVCMACPVRVDCLAYAVAAAEPDGVWGGKNADERGIIRRNRDLYEARYRNARNGTTATDATPDR